MPLKSRLSMESNSILLDIPIELRIESTPVTAALIDYFMLNSYGELQVLNSYVSADNASKITAQQVFIFPGLKSSKTQ